MTSVQTFGYRSDERRRAWRAGMVTTGAAVNPSEMAGRVNGSAVLRCAPALQVTPQARCGSKGP